MLGRSRSLDGAGYWERSEEQVNSRNGYRGWHDRFGDPKLREGAAYPEWLLVPRRRAEQELGTVTGRAT